MDCLVAIYYSYHRGTLSISYRLAGFYGFARGDCPLSGCLFVDIVEACTTTCCRIAASARCGGVAASYCAGGLECCAGAHQWERLVCPVLFYEWLCGGSLLNRAHAAGDGRAAR